MLVLCDPPDTNESIGNRNAAKKCLYSVNYLADLTVAFHLLHLTIILPSMSVVQPE